MNEPTLQQLITEAANLGGAVHPCIALGHDWRTFGGRACPFANELGGGCPNEGQAVEECARCGDVDYGDPGGPGHIHCVVNGPCDPRCHVVRRCQMCAGTGQFVGPLPVGLSHWRVRCPQCLGEGYQETRVLSGGQLERAHA